MLRANQTSRYEPRLSTPRRHTRETVQEDDDTPSTREPAYNSTPRAGPAENEAEGGAREEETAPPAAPPTEMGPEAVAEMAEEDKIEELVNQVVVHSNRPIENLPDLPLPELKVIGRRVVFKGDTLIEGQLRRMWYEGLVGTINKDTVMLIHVTRYAEEDYQAHYESQLEAMRDEVQAAAQRESGQTGTATGSTSDRVFQQRKQDGKTAGMAGSTFSSIALPTNINDAAHPEDNGLVLGGSFVPASKGPEGGSNNDAEDHGETNQRVRNRMRGNTGTMGPIPFVSFSRTHIHDVEFGRDPRSSFYSLFQDPTKQFFDMQCLRMFCRRYIVHTAQGNNPRQIPLRAFVTCRCNCPDLDDELLNRITREEIAHLVKSSRNYKRSHETAAAARERQRWGGVYTAPPGLFQETGILHAHKIPQRLFVGGVCLLLLAVITGVVFGIIQMNIDPNVIWFYARKFLPYVVTSVVLWAVSGALVLVSSSRVQVPVRFCTLSYGGMTLLLLGSAVCGLLTMIMLSRGITLDGLFRFLLTTNQPINVAAYYKKFRCSGLEHNCTLPNPPVMDCDQTAPKFETPCGDSMLNNMQKVLIPSIVFAAFAVFAAFTSLITIYKASRISVEATRGTGRQRRRARRF